MRELTKRRKNTKHKKRSIKRTTKKNIKRRREKGGASIEQLGRAAAMRTWINNTKLYKDLSKIVHSSDLDPYFFSSNKFADQHLRHDSNVEKLLNQIQGKFDKNKQNYFEKLQRKTPSTPTTSKQVFDSDHPSPAPLPMPPLFELSPQSSPSQLPITPQSSPLPPPLILPQPILASAIAPTLQIPYNQNKNLKKYEVACLYLACLASTTPKPL